MQYAPQRREPLAFHGTGGFSLTLELLIGMTLLLITVLSLFLLFPTSERSVLLADKRSQALHQARMQLEEALTVEYSSLPLGESRIEQLVNHTKRRGVTLQTEFKTRVKVTQPDPNLDVKWVEVMVWWDGDEPEGLNRVTLSSAKGVLW